MLEARPIVVNPDNIVLGGNMRLKACKAAGLEEAPVYVASWEEAKAKAFIVKDNVGFGEWDWDILANEWDALELEEWGLDLPIIKYDEEEYSTKVETPIYPTGATKPSVEELYDTRVYDRLLSSINSSNIPEEEKRFLRIAATRHVRFNYGKAADYYAHSSKEAQELFEDSALVIIDYDKAIEKGFVQLYNTLEELSESNE